MVKKKIYNRWISIFLDFNKFISGIRNLPKFLANLRIYSKMPGAEPIGFKYLLQKVYNKNLLTSVNLYYFYQNIWAFEHIINSKYKEHIDIVSNTKFVGLLSRILILIGKLYISLSIGKPRLYFNAYRIHTTKQILKFFSNLKLIEVSTVLDNRIFMKNIDLKEVDSCSYACGLFLFTKI